MKAKPKLLFLGNCAGAHRDFPDWCRTGVLPGMQRLMGKGLVGPRATWLCLFSAPGHLSTREQVRQARHPFLAAIAKRHLEFYRAYTPDYVRTAPFWRHLSAAGKRLRFSIYRIPGRRSRSTAFSWWSGAHTMQTTGSRLVPHLSPMK